MSKRKPVLSGILIRSRECTVNINVKLSLRKTNFQRERKNLEFNDKQSEYMLLHVNTILVSTVSLGIYGERKSLKMILILCDGQKANPVTNWKGFCPKIDKIRWNNGYCKTIEKCAQFSKYACCRHFLSGHFK
jgi:hypothetical protein